MLELPARAAGARLVAADAAPGRGVVGIALRAHRRTGRGGGAEAERPGPANRRHSELVLARRGIEVLGEHGRQFGGFGLLEHHLDAHELPGHLLAQMADETVEELEGLGLVFVQRIALG